MHGSFAPLKMTVLILCATKHISQCEAHIGFVTIPGPNKQLGCHQINQVAILSPAKDLCILFVLPTRFSGAITSLVVMLRISVTRHCDRHTFDKLPGQALVCPRDRTMRISSRRTAYPRCSHHKKGVRPVERVAPARPVNFQADSIILPILSQAVVTQVSTCRNRLHTVPRALRRCAKRKGFFAAKIAEI
jgi:hypothetical protein